MQTMGYILPRALLATFMTLATWTSGSAETADEYPSRPITIVVAFTPGGPTDVMARLVGNKLSATFGKPVIVENKPGAGSNIGTEQVVRAKPDGYTLLVETIANATNASVYKNLSFDAVRDLSPIVQFMTSPSVLVVTPSLPAKDLPTLIALAKSQPGKLSYASSGVGGSPHLAGELFKMRADIDIVHVPYRGATPAMSDVMAGHVAMGFMTSLGAIAQMQAGQLRPIAVAYSKRLPELPDVPTMAEAGLANFEVSSWNGLAAPAGTPRPIIDKLNAEVNKILALPEVQKQMQVLGAQAVGGSPRQFADYVLAETIKWRDVIRKAGISLD